MGLAVTKQEAFWEACGYGRIYEVKAMLEDKDIDVNWKSYTHNCCPIHVASQGKAEIVQLLLEAKCDVNARDDRDNLAIHHAAMKGHADILQRLLDAGSLIDAQDKNGWTSLINAAYWCQPETSKVLVKNSCNVHLKNKDERNALHEACRSQSEDEEGLAEIVQLLVDCGCDLNSKSSDIGEADFTPLMFCGYHGHAKVAKILIDSDCDINAQGSNGWSALHWAADRGQIDTVTALLHGGIDPFLKARRDELALDRATDNMVREAIAEAMNLNGSEYKIALETRGSNGKKLYIPSPTQAQVAELAASPINLSYLNSSPALNALKEQAQVLSTQSKTKKTKRIERKIASRIFEPPKPPPQEEHKKAAPSVGMLDCEFDFMDDEDEAVTRPPTATFNGNNPNANMDSRENSHSPLDNGMENSIMENSQNSSDLVNGNETLEKERELGHISEGAATSSVLAAKG